jgi:hypothetical protein
MADSSSRNGNWAYRSYHNTAEQPIFGEGTLTLVFSYPEIQGTLDMGSGYVLDLQGTMRTNTPEIPEIYEIVGTGRAGTPTAGWEYDYHAFENFHWPRGVNQVRSLVGSVIRAKPHNGEPAGVTGSFIAVKL